MAKFVIQNNYSEFAPRYAFLSMDQVEWIFKEAQNHQPLQVKLEKFLNDFNNFHLNLNLAWV